MVMEISWLEAQVTWSKACFNIGIKEHNISLPVSLLMIQRMLYLFHIAHLIVIIQ